MKPISQTSIEEHKSLLNEFKAITVFQEREVHSRGCSMFEPINQSRIECVAHQHIQHIGNNSYACMKIKVLNLTLLLPMITN